MFAPNRHDRLIERPKTDIPEFHSKNMKRSVTIRREICPIRAKISTHKHGKKLYISYLYD